MNERETIKEGAIKFFDFLAAGAPLTNVSWGVSRRTVQDYYALAAQALKNDTRENAFSQYLAMRITAELSRMGFELNANTAVAIDLVVIPKLPANSIEFTITYDERALSKGGGEHGGS